MTEGTLLLGLIVVALLGAIVSGKHVVEDCPAEVKERPGCVGIMVLVCILGLIGGILLGALQRGHI